ncbi:MAG: xanthine dehydrogenase family protein subunit M [Planctomycetes bacterium]|nr:xanthine dehydrogenase family protein subunit M [Planctomycetota bacterium]
MSTAYLKPASLEDAYTARAEHPDYVLLAGGTDYMVGILHRPAPVGVIDLFGLSALTGIEAGEGVLRIGAAATYAVVLTDATVSESFPSLRTCVSEIGATQIQARGTLGGNIGTSSPVGDTLPVLLALDAILELGSSRGTRKVAYAEFCTGYRQTLLKEDEVIVAIELPLPSPGVQFWRKVGTRKAQAISKVMVAASARGSGETLTDVRLAMGAVADRPIRLGAVEALLEGQVPSLELAEQVRAAVADAITPISDLRSTAPYRLRSAQNLAARFVLQRVEAQA